MKFDWLLDAEKDRIGFNFYISIMYCASCILSYPCQLSGQQHCFQIKTSEGYGLQEQAKYLV